MDCPANVLAEPAMPVVLGAGLAAAATAPVLPPVAVALSWVAGVAAAWLATCARLFAALPFAQLNPASRCSSSGQRSAGLSP